MGFSKAQPTTTSGFTTGTHPTFTFSLGKAPSVGDLVLLVCGWGGTAPGISNVKDANGNPYTQSPSSPNTVFATTGGVTSLFYWIVPQGANPSATITVTFSSQPPNFAVIVDDFTVTGGVAFFDKDAASGSSTAVTLANLPSLTPSYAGELLYAYVNDANGSSAINSPWLGVIEGLELTTGEYQLGVNSVQNPNVTIVSGAFSSIMAAFLVSAPEATGGGAWGGSMETMPYSEFIA